MIAFGDLGTTGKSLVAVASAGLVAMVLVFVPSPMSHLDLFESAPIIDVKAPAKIKLIAMPPSATFDALTLRPLFNKDRKPDPLPPPPEPPKAAIVLGDVSHYRLEGLVVSGEEQLALVRKDGAQLLRLKPGDTVEGWKVDKIDARGVAISGGDRSELLVIPKAQNRAVP